MEFSTIDAGLISNYGEFAIIKIGIIYFFPNTYVFKCITITQPISYEKITIFSTQHIGETDIIFTLYFYNIDFGILYGDFRHII